MKITYVTHACVLVEAGGVTLLTDPWLVGPCWGGNIWHYPPPKLAPEELPRVDFLFLSHGHDDHLHPESLRRIRRQTEGARVLMPQFGAAYFEKAVRANGYDNLQLMGHGESLQLAPGVDVEMLINDRGDHDSALVLRADGATVLLQTDNLMSLGEAERIGRKYGGVDVAFTMCCQTGIFPGFFDFPPQTLAELAREKRARSLQYSVDIVKAVRARRAVPYASDLCYLGALYFVNDLHMTDKRDFAALVKQGGAGIETILMGPGDAMELSAGEVRSAVAPHDFGMKDLSAHAVAMRHEVFASELAERRHAATSFLPDLARFRTRLDDRAARWTGGKFRVLWTVVGERGELHRLGQEFPRPTVDCAADWEFDLAVELPSYRLQRLVRGDYKMGFITLWNGSIRCRRHVRTLTPAESAFWSWAFSNLNSF